MNNFIKNMISSDGKISSKRVVTLAGFILLSMGFTVDLFTDFEISENVYSGIEYIVIAGLGFTASEGFTGKNKTPKTDDSNNV